ncbi:MAG: polysaccharide biosynthesis C-terminal domain-containing protein [Ruminococcus sp.]|nr:polysaccharide biosynthesis C-terminal domain-containing protein [Ruminococcus sp.]
MLIKSKVMRDTVMLTIMQLILDSAALFMNSFITRQLGASAMGILSLMGAFLGIAGILSNGNAFLCTSRLVSEEIGRKNGSPERVLLHAVQLCLILSSIVSLCLIVFAEPICRISFNGMQMTAAVRLMPAALTAGAVAACLKGYFNACRRSAVTAAGDIIEFAVKSAMIAVMTLSTADPDEERVCRILVLSIIGGSAASLIFFCCAFLRLHGRNTGKGTLSLKKYISLAVPIMSGGVLTTILSSTNDALIPVCLRQSGSSVTQALSQFGLFEAIVIPTLFFPSVVLCSLSGIIVSESARASASGSRERIRSMTSRLTELTMIYAVFAAAVLIRFGKPVGILLGGGEEGGRMISLIAPVVPFIYMEIVLEAMIKGLGLQGFSSLNYLAEYAIRISAVLIFVPQIGFYGVAVSYCASNVFGNTMRLTKLLRYTGVSFRPFRMVIFPVLYSALTMGAAELLTRISGTDSEDLPGLVLFTMIWAAGYFSMAYFVYSGKKRSFSNTRDIRSVKRIVQNAQAKA